MAKIKVEDTEIRIIQINDNDYISLTDMLRAKDGEYFFYNWLRNRNTIEFLGIWEKFIIQILILSNSTELNPKPD